MPVLLAVQRNYLTCCENVTISKTLTCRHFSELV